MLGPPRFISGESFGLSGGRHASSGKTVELIVRWKGANDKKQMLNGAPFQSIGELRQVPGSLTPRLGDFQLLPGASSPVPGRTHPPLGSTFHTVCKTLVAFGGQKGVRGDLLHLVLRSSPVPKRANATPGTTSRLTGADVAACGRLARLIGGNRCLIGD